MSLRHAAMRSGKGRPTGKGKRVPDVETLACDSRPGPHWLINDAEGRTYCRGCRRSWVELDAQIRDGRVTIPPPPCAECGRALIKHKDWRSATREQRAAWTAAGITGQHATGVCQACYRRAKKESA